MKEEVRISSDYVITQKIYGITGQQVPSTATIEVFDNGGAVVQASASATIDSFGTITHTLTAASNATLGNNFKAVISYTLDSVDSQEVQLFDVVTHPIPNNVSYERLFEMMPDLRKDIMDYSGRLPLIGGSTTTFTDTGLTVDARDWKGARGKLIFGDGSDHEFRITVYDKASGAVTFSPAYSAAPPVDTKYELRESYQDMINKTYWLVQNTIRNKYGLAAGFIDSTVLDNLVIYKTLELISLSGVEVEGDKWDYRYKAYKDLYSQTLTGFYEAYDSNEDGNIDDQENINRTSSSTLKRANIYGQQ